MRGKMKAGLEHPGFRARLGELSAASDRVWLLGLSVGLIFTVVAAAHRCPYLVPIWGKFWVYAGLLIRASLYLWAGETLRQLGGLVLSRLLGMGLVAGAFELLVDPSTRDPASAGALAQG